MVTFNTRIRMKSDTTENWTSQRTFIPLEGQIIIYTDYEQKTDGNGNVINIPAIKVGDGTSYGVDLPFVGDDIRDTILAHISSTEHHTTALQKIFWNNKINVTDTQQVVENVLIFNRN